MPSDLPRLLDAEPVPSLDAYREGGGGAGLEAAARLGPAAVIEELEASGLRGRGGGGFPTGTKWRTVAGNASPTNRATVVINAAEGEPGSFKDRTLVSRNPYRILEGALIAAQAVAAHRVIVAMKASFTGELARVRTAIRELEEAGWADNVTMEVLEGPEEYLFGEESALLEVVEGRPPFPRVAPPFRHGAEEVDIEDDGRARERQRAARRWGVGAQPPRQRGEGDASAADVQMAGTSGTAAAPTLANNAETLANVPGILANGPAWFRQLGTAESPGTIVCTVTGWVQRSGVGEVAMGTTLRQAITEIAGGPPPGNEIRAVLSGVANPFLPASALDTPLTYEDMTAASNGLGAAGFMVFDDSVDLVAVAQGVARFLAVESCGQCTPCKQDGLAIAAVLDRFCRSNATEHDTEELSARLETVTDEARCYLATQQQRVVNSLLALFPEALSVHLETSPDRAAAVTPVLIAPLTRVGDGVATLDETHTAKQPDWTHDEIDSGTTPAERLDFRG